MKTDLSAAFKSGSIFFIVFSLIHFILNDIIIGTGAKILGVILSVILPDALLPNHLKRHPKSFEPEMTDERRREIREEMMKDPVVASILTFSEKQKSISTGRQLENKLR